MRAKAPRVPRYAAQLALFRNSGTARAARFTYSGAVDQGDKTY